MDFRVLTDRGAELRRAGLVGEAEEALRDAVRLGDHPFSWLNLGNLFLDDGRLDEAEAALSRSLELAPLDDRPAHTLGMALLAQGRYPEGWPLYERRPKAPLPGREWRGEALAGKRLVIWPEQGFGDAIMCARYLPLLAERAAELSFVCPPPLAPLLAGLGVEIIPREQVFAVPPADYAVHLFSLPLHFGTTLATIPAPVPIQIEPRRVGARIGVKWRGRPTHGHDQWRSLPMEDAVRLLELPGAMSLEPEDTGATDFRETAEIVAGLDLVVSVDTAVAHLAGSLGVPTWILLAAIGTDWRWLRDRTDSPWYPTARLFRQSSAEAGWVPVVAEVERLVAVEDGQN